MSLLDEQMARPGDKTCNVIGLLTATEYCTEYFSMQSDGEVAIDFPWQQID